MRVLVLNAGRARLKASLVEDGPTVARADGPRGSTMQRRSTRCSASSAPMAAARRGRRTGSCTAATGSAAPVIVDDGVVDGARRLVALAPLHMPPALAALRAAVTRFPDVPHVVLLRHGVPRDPAGGRDGATRCPAAWATDWGVRRFGFHGLSVAVVGAAGRRSCSAGPSRSCCLVVAHLGGGCSVTAVAGRPVGAHLDGLHARWRG